MLPFEVDKININCLFTSHVDASPPFGADDGSIVFHFSPENLHIHLYLILDKKQKMVLSLNENGLVVY